MNTDQNDTIAALCTAPGGALAIVRVSGPEALRVGCQVWHGHSTLGAVNARRMLLGKVSSPGEPCLAVFMPGPHSYTGEDTVELHCHGGSFAPKRLLESVLSAGARSAEPGEFTRRAFLNGKMDLTQAEAVADLIAAKSERAAHLAEKQLSGSIGNAIRNLREPLIHLRSEMESRLDFSEEDLDWESPELYLTEIQNVQNEIPRLLKTAEAGAVLREGVCVVIAGRPNAGKSSLLNALLGYDRAIVTAIPGTTRDTLEEFVSLRNIPVRLTDTAGLHENAVDPVEKIGIDRSRVSLRNAKIIFWVLDASNAENALASAEYLKQQYSGRQQIIALWNKTDSPDTPEVLPPLPDNMIQLRISARTGYGLNELLDRFSDLVWEHSASTEEVSECEISARHAALLRETETFLSAAADEVKRESWELAAFNLREALARLGNITGEEIAPDILDEIFSRFCIGK